MGWRLCCLPSNRLRYEFVGCVFSEVPQLILFCFFHVCQCTYKFDIFDPVLPLSNPEFSTLDPWRTSFRWYFCWIFIFTYCFLCIDYSDLHTAMQMCGCTDRASHRLCKNQCILFIPDILSIFFHLPIRSSFFTRFPILLEERHLLFYILCCNERQRSSSGVKVVCWAIAGYCLTDLRQLSIRLCNTVIELHSHTLIYNILRHIPSHLTSSYTESELVVLFCFFFF